MPIDQAKLKPTKFPGVFKMPDGRLLAKCSIRTPDGKVVVRKQVMPVGATEVDTVNTVAALKAAYKHPPSTSIPTPLPPTTSLTVESYSALWLAARRGNVKPSIARTYESCLSHHILPWLGHLPCDQVNRLAIEGWKAWARNRQQARQKTVKDADGKTTTVTILEPYADDTMAQWWRVLKFFMKDMAADRDMKDPIGRLEAPVHAKSTPKKREQRVLDLDGIGSLLETAREHCAKRYPEIAMVVLTGMRPGEVYALKWECIDFARNEVLLCRGVSDGILTDSTKTNADRTVALHPHLIEVLQAHRQQQLAENHRAKLATGLVFPSDAATLRDANSLDKPFAKLCKIMDIELNLGNQVLRRSMNSNLVDAGVDRLVIRANMGHTTEKMTARYYNAKPADKQAAVAILPIRRRRKDEDDA